MEISPIGQIESHVHKRKSLITKCGSQIARSATHWKSSFKDGGDLAASLLWSEPILLGDLALRYRGLRCWLAGYGVQDLGCQECSGVRVEYPKKPQRHNQQSANATDRDHHCPHQSLHGIRSVRTNGAH